MNSARTKVVGYTRVSTDKQVEEGLSLDAQREKITMFCKLHDLDLVEIIEDAGVSAKTLDRPGVQRALAMLDAGQAEALVICKLDRLTRSVRDLADSVEKYFAKKCSLFSISDSINTRSAAGRAMCNMLGTFAQWEREAIAERTAEAMAHKKANGEFCGGLPPYGFANENGLLVRNEAEQGVLSVVAELKAAGLSLRGIAAELDRAGIRARNGKTFAATQIARMVA